MNKEELQFPRVWEYRLIASSKKELEEAIFEIIDKEYEIEDSNRSKNGKYISVNLKIEVLSKKEMIDIFEKFNAHSYIKYVI